MNGRMGISFVWSSVGRRSGRARRWPVRAGGRAAAGAMPARGRSESDGETRHAAPTTSPWRVSGGACAWTRGIARGRAGRRAPGRPPGRRARHTREAAVTVFDRDRWRALEPLLDRALELPTVARTPWLGALRADSPSLAEELHALLAGESAAD